MTRKSKALAPAFSRHFAPFVVQKQMVVAEGRTM